MSIFANLNRQVKDVNLPNFDIPVHIKERYRFFSKMPAFIQSYLMSRISLSYSPNTIQRYIYDFKFFFDYVFDKTEAAIDMVDIQLEDFIQIDSSGIQSYANYLAIEVKNNSKTINRKLSSLKSLFDFLKQKEMIQMNPVEGIERPKVQKRDPVYLTSHEYKQLLQFILSTEHLTKRQQRYYDHLKYRDAALFHLMIMTGLRLSEVSHLKLKNIQLDAKEIAITGKGNKERKIPLNESTLKMLQTYLEHVPPVVRPIELEDPFFSGYNFKTNEFQKGISSSTIQKMITKHIKRAKEQLPFLKYKNITAHKLRHSFATELIYRGIDVLTIQSLLGHESVATTQIYAHVQDEAKKKAVSTLE